MIDCKETAFQIDKAQFSKLKLWKKMNVKFHMMLCGVCKKYYKDSHALNKIIKHVDFKIPKLTDQDKIQMKEKISR